MTDNNKLTTVMYHYVRDLNKSKFPNIKGLDLALFNKQIDYLQARYNIVTIESVINHIEGRHNLPSKPLLLTFDDGFADHYNNVFPVLMSRGIYACFYVSAKCIVEKIVLDWNNKNYQALHAGYIQSQLNWHKRQIDKVLPPNCDNDSYYKNMGIKCIDCTNTKNPVNFSKRKFFAHQKHKPKKRKTKSS